MIDFYLPILLQSLQFLVPIPTLYFSKTSWFNSNLSKSLFIVFMIASIPLINIASPVIQLFCVPQILMLYPIFAIGFILTLNNLPVSILLTCILAEAHELPAHLFLRTNIVGFGILGSFFHGLIIFLWIGILLLVVCKMRDLKINNFFVILFLIAFTINTLIYFFNPLVDISPISIHFVAKRLVWFVTLTILCMRGRSY